MTNLCMSFFACDNFILLLGKKRCRRVCEVNDLIGLAYEQHDQLVFAE